MSTPIYADLQAFVRTTGRICVVKAPRVLASRSIY